MEWSVVLVAAEFLTTRMPDQVTRMPVLTTARDPLID